MLAINGEIGPPCGVPFTRATMVPSGISIGAFNQRATYSRDPFLVRVTLEGLYHQIPWHGVEEGFDVKVDDPILLPAPLPAHSDCVQWGTPGPVAVGIVMEHSFHARLQHHHRHLLRDPIDHIRDTEDPGPVPPFLCISTARTGPGK